MTKHPLFLAQSDTTVGFLSKDYKLINKTKNRDEETPLIEVFASFSQLKKKIRVPDKIKKRVKRAKKTTFILSNKRSFRVVFESSHKRFLENFGPMFSSSANEHKKSFDLDFALNSADIVVLDSRGLYESSPSSIIKTNGTKLAKLR